MSSDYSSERYDPTLPHCGDVRLSFNGRTLTLTGSGETQIYPAVSGRPQGRPGGGVTFGYSRERQRQSGVGPIPEGIYWIRPDELSAAGWFRNTEAWGNFRITDPPLHDDRNVWPGRVLHPWWHHTWKCRLHRPDEPDG